MADFVSGSVERLQHQNTSVGAGQVLRTVIRGAVMMQGA
jgi:hypothetical protein